MAERGSAARHTFYYLLILVTLGFTATGVGQIFFQVINALLPETSYSYEGVFDEWTLRFGITAVVVTAPLFFICTRAINKELSKGTLDMHSLVRKWLTYLILFCASITIIIDLMVTFYGFLNGDLTSKFILKSLVIAGIAGGIFLYYLYDIGREKTEKNDGRLMIYRNLFFVVIIAALVLGLYFNTNPLAVRAEREDEERVRQISSIHYQIDSYYQDADQLPENLEAIEAFMYVGQTRDPVTNEPFEYRVIDENTYEICAEFAFSNREEDPYTSWRDTEWLHDAGRHCFQKSVQSWGEREEIRIPEIEDFSGGDTELPEEEVPTPEIRRQEVPLPPQA